MYGLECGFILIVFGIDIYINGVDGGWKVFNCYDGGLNVD